MYWVAIRILDKLNKFNDYYDPTLLDRSLELREGIDSLKLYHPDIITSKSDKATEEEYLQKGYEEYLQDEDAVIAQAEELANSIAEYELWAEEQQRAAGCQNADFSYH